LHQGDWSSTENHDRTGKGAGGKGNVMPVACQSINEVPVASEVAQTGTALPCKKNFRHYF